MLVLSLVAVTTGFGETGLCHVFGAKATKFYGNWSELIKSWGMDFFAQKKSILTVLALFKVWLPKV
jgi:hypothetical protein